MREGRSEPQADGVGWESRCWSLEARQRGWAQDPSLAVLRLRSAVEVGLRTCQEGVKRSLRLAERSGALGEGKCYVNSS